MAFVQCFHYNILVCSSKVTSLSLDPLKVYLVKKQANKQVKNKTKQKTKWEGNGVIDYSGILFFLLK